MDIYEGYSPSSASTLIVWTVAVSRSDLAGPVECATFDPTAPTGAECAAGTIEMRWIEAGGALHLYRDLEVGAVIWSNR